MNYLRKRPESGGQGRRPNRRLDFQAVRAGIAAELKRLYSRVLDEPIPDKMAELPKQLDQPPGDGQHGENSQLTGSLIGSKLHQSDEKNANTLRNCVKPFRCLFGS